MIGLEEVWMVLDEIDDTGELKSETDLIPVAEEESLMVTTGGLIEVEIFAEDLVELEGLTRAEVEDVDMDLRLVIDTL